MLNIAIPSYNRTDILKSHTLNFLSKLTIPHKIHIFVNPIEFKLYQLAYPDNNIIVGGRNLRQQRDCIRNYFPENELILILDDDILDIIPSNLDDCINNCINYIKENNITLLGINPTRNEYFKSNKFNTNFLLVAGCFYFEINSKNKLYYISHLDSDEKEDYYRTITHFHFGKIARNDNFNINHYYYTSSGGLNYYDRYEENSKQSMKLFINNRLLFDLISKKHCLDLKFLYNQNKSYYLDYKEHIKQDSQYVDFCSNVLNFNKTFNYLFDKSSNQLLGIVIKNVLPNTTNEELQLYKFISKNCYNENRGPISGEILDSTRLYGTVKTHFDNGDYKYCSKDSKHRIYYGDKTFQICNRIYGATIGLNKFGELTKDTDILKNKLDILKDLSNIINCIYNNESKKLNFDIPVRNYKLLETSFSNLQINIGLRSAIHKDTNNIGFAAIVCLNNIDIEKEDYIGCNLLLPDYDVELNLTNNDLFIFDSTKIRHCNGDVSSDNLNRVSLVYYIKK